MVNNQKIAIKFVSFFYFYLIDLMEKDLLKNKTIIILIKIEGTSKI